jgi:DNA-binding transcriptional LysR family regulator
VGFEPDIHYRVVSFPVIVGLVRQGLGVSLVPRMAVHGDRRGVRFMDVPGRRLQRTVFTAVRPASRNRPAVHAALAALRHQAARMTPS